MGEPKVGPCLGCGTKWKYCGPRCCVACEHEELIESADERTEAAQRVREFIREWGEQSKQVAAVITGEGRYPLDISDLKILVEER